MEALRPLLDVAVRLGAALPDELRAGLAQKRWVMGDLVKELGPYLTNKDESIRARAVALIGALLAVIEPLDETQTGTLAAFFAARLQDYASVPDALRALLVLVQQHPVPAEQAALMLRGVFTEVSVQGLAQPARHSALSLLLQLLVRQAAAVRAMAGDFVFGVVQAMDGERDPRNLLVAFQLVRLTCLAMPPEVRRFEEELFELLAAYFPVSYRERPNDPPGALSATELAEALDDALCAHSGWASMCVPFLLEKLSTSTPGTTAHALRALRRCMHHWGGAVLAPHIDLLWPSLQRAIQDGTEKEAALGALRELAELLARHDTRALRRLLAPLMAVCVPPLDICAASALPAASMLAAVACEPIAAHEVMTQAMPPLLTAMSASPSPVGLQCLAMLVPPLLTASSPSPSISTSISISITPVASASTVTPALAAPLHAALTLLTRLAVPPTAQQLQLLALPPLAHLLARQPDPASLSALVKSVTPVTPITPVTSASSAPTSVPSASSVLVSLATAQAQAIEEHVMPALLTHIEHIATSTSVSANADLAVLSSLLVSLLCASPARLAPQALPRVAHLLTVTLANANDCALVSAFLLPFSRATLSPVASQCHTHLLPALYSLPLHPTLVPLLTDLVAQLAASDAAPASWLASQRAVLHDLPPDVPSAMLPSVVLPAVAFAASHCNTIDVDVASLLARLSVALVQPATAPTHLRVPLLTLLCALVNKWMDADVEAFVSGTVCNAWLSLAHTGSAQAAEGLLWCAAGQALRNDVSTAQKLVPLIVSAPMPVAVLLAHSFAALLGDAPLTSPHVWHARLSVLHRQRLFTAVLPSLNAVLAAPTALSTERVALVLVAALSLFGAVPVPVLTSVPARVSALILCAVQQSDDQVRTRALALLARLLPTLPELASPLHSLLDALVVATSPTAPLALLAESLRCLHALLSLPSSRLVGHRTAVLAVLAKCLDLPRRDLRQQAAAVRNAWFLLSASAS